MNIQKVDDFLVTKYGAENVKYLGKGSDSVAYRVGDNVFRFTDKNNQIYQREADICNFVRACISCRVPDIKVHREKGFVFAVHEMLQGKKWSWHKFMFQPRRQRNLAKSCAEFMAQLHGLSIADVRRAVPTIDAFGYIDFESVRPFVSQCLPEFVVRFFERNYLRVISDVRTKSDLAIVHLGIKGANSVCNQNGTLCGVYDFGNCGIYERSREFVPFLMGGNKRLYRAVCRQYKKLTGNQIDARRVRDLAEIEFMSEKRWAFKGSTVQMNNIRFFQRRLAAAILHFAHLPRFILRPVLLWYMAWRMGKSSCE